MKARRMPGGDTAPRSVKEAQPKGASVDEKGRREQPHHAIA